MKIMPIHTLDARDNVMLEVIRDYLGINNKQMLIEIQSMRHSLSKLLSKKGINYDDLRAALVPSRERREIALVFDTSRIQNPWYGYEVFKNLIPILDKKSKNSILVGDYIGTTHQQNMLFDEFEKSVTRIKNIEYRHSNLFYIVYINNLTKAAFSNLAYDLNNFGPYVGFAETTYDSFFKTLLSLRLVNLCVKIGNRIIQSHEDDRDDSENVNISSYPFEENGYTCLSIPSNLYGVMLSYKIERPVFDGFESDTYFSLNAVNSLVMQIDDFDIQVDDDKLEYIKVNKSYSLHKAGLTEITSSKLREIIKLKIKSNYIYNMSYLDNFNITKFSIVIEVYNSNGKRFRLMAALEYRPNEKLLRLLTLY